MIVAFLLGYVDIFVGWSGVALIAALMLTSRLVSPLAGQDPIEVVVLHSWLLVSKDSAYRHVLDRFRNGATMIRDGVAFDLQPDNDIACAIAATTPQLNEKDALTVANQAKSVFDHLTANSPEFATAVAGRDFSVSVMSSFNQNVEELFRFEGTALDEDAVRR